MTGICCVDTCDSQACGDWQFSTRQVHENLMTAHSPTRKRTLQYGAEEPQKLARAITEKVPNLYWAGIWHKAINTRQWQLIVHDCLEKASRKIPSSGWWWSIQVWRVFHSGEILPLLPLDVLANAAWWRGILQNISLPFPRQHVWVNLCYSINNATYCRDIHCLLPTTGQHQDVAASKVTRVQPCTPLEKKFLQKFSKLIFHSVRRWVASWNIVNMMCIYLVTCLAKMSENDHIVFEQ